MATSRGKSNVQRFIGQLPAQIERKVLRGAAKAAGTVIAGEAKARATSHEVRDALVVKPARTGPTEVAVKVTIPPGWARSLGIWAEYGTAEHFISVDRAASGGRTAGRVNRQVNGGARDAKHSLIINGKPVGTTVHHPGAKKHPFLRVALDHKEAEAIAAARAFINSRITPAGITGGDEPEGEDA